MEQTVIQIVQPLTLHQIFIFWYAIMLGIMITTIGARPKRIETVYDNEKISEVDLRLVEQEEWRKDRTKPKSTVDRLIEGVLAFETVEFWEIINRCIGNWGLISYEKSYKIPKPSTEEPSSIVRYTEREATFRLIFSIFTLSIFPVILATTLLKLAIPNESWSGDFWSFFFASIPAFVPFYIYRIYIGLLYLGSKIFYGSDWQAYFQLGLASRPVVNTRPWNHIFPGVLFLGAYTIPTITFFRYRQIEIACNNVKAYDCDLTLLLTLLLILLPIFCFILRNKIFKDKIDKYAK